MGRTPARAGRGRIMTLHVYEALTADGQSAYVGLTTNVKRRMSAHKRTSSWFMAAAEWRVLGEYENETDAYAAEIEAIRSRRPLFNTRANPNAHLTHAHILATPPNPHLIYNVSPELRAAFRRHHS